MTSHPPLPAGLYVVATPIGALGDLTLRARDILGTAPVIAAEDTRVLKKLLMLHGIKLGDRRVVAYHDHSDARARKTILDLAREDAVALVSDAGTPMVADPGFALVRDAAEAGISVVAAPGASSVLAALTVAGLPTNRFLFAGFLPSKRMARARELSDLAALPVTLVFFEAPARIEASIRDMVDTLGPHRPAAICRELTKRHEQVARGPLEDLLARLSTDIPHKGEFVVVVGPPEAEAPSPQFVDAALLEALKDLSVRDAAREVAETLDLPRKEVYRRALELKS